MSKYKDGICHGDHFAFTYEGLVIVPPDIFVASLAKQNLFSCAAFFAWGEITQALQISCSSTRQQ